MILPINVHNVHVTIRIEFKVCFPGVIKAFPNDEPFAIVVFDQEEAVVHEEEHHAYLIASLVSSWYEICKSSFESTAIEGIRPTSPTVSTDMFVQDDAEVHDAEHVMYFRSLVENKL